MLFSLEMGRLYLRTITESGHQKAHMPESASRYISLKSTEVFKIDEVKVEGSYHLNISLRIHFGYLEGT